MNKQIIVSGLLLATMIVALLARQNQKVVKQQRMEKKVERIVRETFEKNEEKIQKAIEQRTKRQKNKIEGAQFIKNYSKLAKTLMMTQEQKNLKEELLSDPSIIRKSFLYLIEVNSSEKLQDRISNSMEVIDYLAEAMRWEENPMRDDAIEKSKYFLLDDTLDRTRDEKELRTLATDKAELYLILREVAPAAARQIRDSAKGTKLAAVIQFAEDQM